MESSFATEQKFDPSLLDVSRQMDAFEGYLGPHGSRVADIADAIGRAFHLAAHDRFFLQQAALVHDLGEVVMDRGYLKENRILTADEYIDMQRHPVIGEQETAKRGMSRGVQLLVRWHHEWWNGSGYPDGLEGEEIPLPVRILRVADTFSALTGDRPFRKAIPVADARKYLIEWAGIEFDPRVTKALLSMHEFFEPEHAAEPAAGSSTAAVS
jgi:HD-GYP domain-containing protein (c-di-GMP phosphodiesterase class II)